jgi:hypothetical protein
LEVVVLHVKPRAQSDADEHLSLHAAAPHANGLHGAGLFWMHWPWSSQAKVTACPDVHAGVPQVLPAGG